MKFTLLHKITLAGIPIFFLSVMTLFAQTTISGKVTDGATGETVLGANIVLKGTSTGTTTDIDGNYTIEISGDNPTLVFSFIGYESVEVVVGSQTTINVEMKADQKMLDEVVVTGYQVQKKSLVTGSIASIKPGDVVSVATRPEQALQGKAAGVSVLPKSGSPGAGMSVRIRGAGSNGKSEPLYIVDGMKSGDINYLDPSDIQSIEVLKDAAASAIYGSEGANGVVIITTKSGKAGSARVDYSFSYGIQSAPNAPSFMNGQQYTDYMSEVYAAGIADGSVDISQLTANSSNTTDWLSQITEDAPMIRHNLSISGGNEKSTYFVGLGYLNQDGVVGGGDYSSFERITARFNGSHKPLKWLELGNNLALTNTKRSTVLEDDPNNGLINSALMMDPTTPATYTGGLPAHVQSVVDRGEDALQDANGNYYGISSWINSGEIYNPLARRAQYKNDLATDNKLLGTIYAKITPMKGLSITSRMGIDLAYQSFSDYTIPFYANGTEKSNGLTVRKDEKRWQTWLWENFATYNTTIKDVHNISAIVGISSQEYVHDNLGTSAGPMFNNDPAYAYPNVTRTRENDVVSGTRERTKMASQFARLSYDYKEKYQLELTARRDGSSLFGPNNRYGIFPSVSAGWSISEEAFWDGMKEKVNMFKVRASWGQNGSLSNLGADQYRSLIVTYGIDYVDGEGNKIPGAEPEALSNPDLKWEVSEQTNIGIDLEAFNSRVYGTFDWFNKVTKDLITRGQVSYEFGNTAPFVNGGDVTNKGIELLLGYRDTKAGIKYDVNFNVTHINNEVTFLNSAAGRVPGAGLPTAGTLTYFEEGQPIWYFRGYKTDGIDPQTGEPNYVDQNADGEINEDDKVRIGSPHQKLQYGANVNLAYKGVDFNVFLQGASGGNNYIGFIRADRPNVNRLEWFYNNRWTESNTNASLPRADYSDSKFFSSDLLVDDASYLKVRQIQIGYTFPSALLEKVKIKSLRAYVSLNNYFTFTKYKGWEPEVGSDKNERLGVDFGYYPVPRNMMFGVNVSL